MTREDADRAVLHALALWTRDDRRDPSRNCVPGGELLDATELGFQAFYAAVGRLVSLGDLERCAGAAYRLTAAGWRRVDAGD